MHQAEGPVLGRSTCHPDKALLYLQDALEGREYAAFLYEASPYFL